MHRPTIIATSALTLGLTAICGSAAAQTVNDTPAQTAGQTRTLTPAPQYMSWSGRGAAVMPVRDADTSTPRRRPNTVIPHGGFANAVPMPRPEAPSRSQPRTLTPASTWTASRPAPQPAPTSGIAQAPALEAAAPAELAAVDLPPPSRAPSYQPRIQPGPMPQSQTQAPLPEYLSGQGGGQPVPSQAVYAGSQPTPAPAAPVYAEPVAQPPAEADPMAPRRDAPIFRMQRQQAVQPNPEPERAPAQTAAAPAPSAQPAAPRQMASVSPNPGDQPVQQSARRYSVHRQNGQQPDAVPLPAPSYVDALAVTLTETPASQDLAEPAPGPNLYRDARGRVRAAPAASDGDHQ